MAPYSLKMNASEIAEIKRLKSFWPPYSTYMSVMDFVIWMILAKHASFTPHIALDSLKSSLQATWDNL